MFEVHHEFDKKNVLHFLVRMVLDKYELVAALDN